MKILADENVSALIVARLQANGHLVKHAANIAHKFADPDVLAMARDCDALLVTEDKDFGDLVMVHRLPSSGVLLLRLQTLSAAQTVDLVVHTINQHGDNLLKAFTVLRASTERITTRIIFLA